MESHGSLTDHGTSLQEHHRNEELAEKEEEWDLDSIEYCFVDQNHDKSCNDIKRDTVVRVRNKT